MKIETKLQKFVHNILKDTITDGFSIIIDAKTDIWYLVGFDINKKLFIINKAETGEALDRVKTLFPGYAYDNLKKNEYDLVDMFPGFNQTIHVCLVNDEDEELGYYASLGMIYETIN